MLYSKEISKGLHYVFLFLLINCVQNQGYQIGFNYPFLMSSKNLSIVNINFDSNNNIYTVFNDGSVRKYLPDLSSYTNQVYIDPVQTITFNSLYMTILTIIPFTLNTSIQIVTSQNSTALAIYDNYNFSFIQSYIMGELILDYFISTFSYPNSTAFSFGYITCTQFIYVVFKSQKYNVFDFSNFGNNTTAMQGSHSSQIFLFQSYGFITYTLAVTLSNGNIIQVYLTMNLNFNYTANTYDFSNSSATYAIMKNLVEKNINFNLDFANKFIIMQTYPSNNYQFIDLALYTVGTVNNTNLNAYKMIQIVNFNSNTYLLTTVGLISLFINRATAKMALNSLVVPLPLNANYYISQGSSSRFDILYIRNSPYIYKSGQCVGQTILVNSVCVSYNCSDPNCLFCPINNVTCGTCNTGFIKNQSFICVRNLSSNLTNQTNSKNQAYQTDHTIINNYYIFLIQQIQILLQILQELLGYFQAIISVPGARAVVTPLFYLFGNFDDLYLYQFHDREYSSVITDFFNQLNNLQIKKWNLVNSTQIISLFMNIKAFNNFTNFQQQYQQYSYLENTVNANQSQGLFYNSESYFITTVPIVIAYFCIFHQVFLISSRYFFSKLVRKFYFWAFLSILLFDGNIQQLCFYMIRQWSSIFIFNFYQKIYKMVIIYFGFSLVFVGSGLYYLANFLYKLKVSVIIENVKRNTLGLLVVTVQFGLKNIGLSFLHFYGRSLSYITFMGCLASNQLLFLLFITVIINYKVFNKCLGMWIFFLLSLLRLFLIVTFIIDYHNLNQQLLYYCQFNLILLMILLFVIGTTAQTIKILFDLKQFVKKHLGCNQKAKISIRIKQTQRPKPQQRPRTLEIIQPQADFQTKPNQQNNEKQKCKKKSNFQLKQIQKPQKKKRIQTHRFNNIVISFQTNKKT